MAGKATTQHRASGDAYDVDVAPTSDAFRANLRVLLARTGLSMRGLSAAMGRDPGYVAALLDPTRPPRARPTPEDLLRASDATGISVVELLELLWDVPRERLAAELVADGFEASVDRLISHLADADRRELGEYARFLAERAGRRGPP